MPEELKKFWMVMWDIPTSVKPRDYPHPAGRVRTFSVMLQYSVWVCPEGHLSRIDPIAEDVRAVGGSIEVLPYSEVAYDKVMKLARAALERECQRIQSYIEHSIVETRKRLTDAAVLQSVNDTNKAIHYQQAALTKALRDLNDAAECSVAFDLTGELEEVLRGARKAVAARSSEFVIERDMAQAAVVAPCDPAIDPNQGSLPEA
jgi:regulator of sigma D